MSDGPVIDLSGLLRRLQAKETPRMANDRARAEMRRVRAQLGEIKIRRAAQYAVQKSKEG